MSDLLITEAVNLFCGNDEPDKSKHLTLTELQLPTLAETMADHRPGGGTAGIEVPLGVEKFGATFKLNGEDPDLMVHFGLGGRANKVYTGYGSIVSKRTGAVTQMKTVMEGRLGRVTPDAFQKGQLKGHDYMIGAIMHYELFHDDRELIYFDFFSNTWRVDGVDQNAATNRALNLA